MNVFLWCAVGLNNIAQPTLAVVSLATVDNMEEVLMGIAFAPVCSLMMKITMCPPKEIFSKSATTQNSVREIKRKR